MAVLEVLPQAVNANPESQTAPAETPTLMTIENCTHVPPAEKRCSVKPSSAPPGNWGYPLTRWLFAIIIEFGRIVGVGFVSEP